MTWAKRWQVPSGSNNDTYVVGLSETGDYACTCIGWTRHTPRKDCKHIRAIKIFPNYEMPVDKSPIVQRQDQDLMKRPGRLIDLPD